MQPLDRGLYKSLLLFYMHILSHFSLEPAGLDRA